MLDPGITFRNSLYFQHVVSSVELKKCQIFKSVEDMSQLLAILS